MQESPKSAGGSRRAPSFLPTVAWLVVVVALVVAVAGIGVTATASPASALPVRGAAFVLADQATPSKGCYTPDPAFSMNTSDVWDATGTLNQVCRSGPGRYRVRFGNLGILGGVAHVTAFTNGASSPTQCKIVSTGPSGGDQFVEVFCHSMGGAAVDSMFSASFTSVATPPGHLPFLPDASFGYLRSPQNLGAVHPHTCIDADPRFDYNSRGGTGTAVCKRDVGVYEVWVRAQVARTGNVQVTAYGAGAARCKAHRWNAATVGHIIGVRCFAATGGPTDSAFTFSHVRDGSILGVELCCHPNGHDSAYAWASQPTATSYDLDPLFQFNRLPHHRATGERLGKGRYTTRYDSDPDLDHGTAIVTARGRGPEFCNLALWSRPDGIRTNCFDPSGAPADTDYAVAFTSRWQLG